MMEMVIIMDIEFEIRKIFQLPSGQLVTRTAISGRRREL